MGTVYNTDAIYIIGAFGEVRTCTHRKTGIQRAVKIIKKAFLQGKEETRFLQEINILKSMVIFICLQPIIQDHPNIVRIFEVYQDVKRYFIVTEVCNGGELFDQILKRGFFSERDAAVIMKQVLSAISYCHSLKIVHRDLKPENLLLDQDDDNFTLKVIDFGTSQTFDKAQRLHQTYGTPYYIAPEILQGDYTESCDVWSCGVILYILLNGHPPFDGKSDQEILQAVMKGVYQTSGPVWSKISEEGQDLIRKMLAFDGERRITAQNALLHPWFLKNIDKNALTDSKHTETLKNLNQFNTSSKFQQAALAFMTNHMITQDETKQLMKTFEALDLNKDGRLSKDEIIAGYTLLEGAHAAESEAGRIMEMADVDKNGTIDYSEFVTATLNKTKLLTQERMKIAFEFFDKVRTQYSC